MTATTHPFETSAVAENHMTSRSNPLRPLYYKVMEGERLTREEGIAVYQSHDLLSVGILADTARKIRTKPAERDYIYWVHNYHINPTNICEAHCTFCSFKKGPKSPYAYMMSVEQVLDEVRAYPDHATLREFHIVAGLYDKADLAYYETLFKALREAFPHVTIKALTAVEIDYLAKLEGIPAEQVLQVLKAAGLQAMPGGGAEVFAERVRQQVCLDKISGEDWCRIHGLAHGMGIPTNATMLAGLGETPEERIDHILTIRNQQDKSGGFLSFIPLNCYYENNKINDQNALTGYENLKNFAVSRLLLDNVPHIKSFWIHIGEKISQVSLSFGVDDIDGTVVMEKIAHAAGTQTAQTMSRDELLHLIHQAGKTAVERDTFYNTLSIVPPAITPPEQSARVVSQKRCG